MISRILVANRSEIALRVIRACREMGIWSVAAYSEADRDNLAVELADQAVCIGPPPGRESYLNYQRILAAAQATKCQAIHPGYGFLAENALFAEACEALGLIFIGPPGQVIRKMGDKTMARRLMKDAGLPVVPGSAGDVSDAGQLTREAEKIGFPILIKAAAGGGGRGMRVVHEATQLLPAYQQAVAEAENAFADNRVYLEKFLNDPKHIEVQVLIDQQGHGVHLYERDCSMQRRHQKLIEESPSACLEEAERREICLAALNAVQALGYHSAGTVEFLWDQKQRKYYFMEMNTRIQVEHPVSEMLTGIDLIRLQIEVAAGKNLSFSQEDVQRQGHVIECRINAEDHRRGFRPTPGRITRFTPPGGPGVRVDTACQSNALIPPHYDSLIAKLICWGAGRQQARQRMLRALHEFRIEGVPTTIPVCRWLLKQPEFISGDYSTRFLDQRPDEVANV